MPKFPWQKWFPQDWKSDPKLSRCSPATRGIWIDALCSMMMTGTYKITGTPDELARDCRCTKAQVLAANEDLKKCQAADVSMQNGCISWVCRRLLRYHNIKEMRSHAASTRWSKRDANTLQTDDANSDARSASASASASIASPGNRGVGEGGFSEAPSWEEFWAYCQTQACLLPAEWYAMDKWEAANASNWKDKSNWKAYARRCKGWWESDGRPMTPPASRNSANGKALSPFDYKTIIQAKQTQADSIKNKFCSETAIDQVWASEPKRQEYITLRREIKDLTAKLGAYGT